MYDNFKIANYNNSLVSPEFYAKPLSRLFSGDVIDGLTVVPGTGLQVTLQPGNAFLRYGSAAVASARIVSLVADFNLAIPTPDASNPRIDLVVVYVDTAVALPVVDATHPPTSANLDGPGVPKAKIVSGTPAATPVAPNAGAIQSAVGASNPYTVVAQVLVDKAPVSVIAAGKITDLRKRAALGSKNVAFTLLEDTKTGFTANTTATTDYVLGPGIKMEVGFGFITPGSAVNNVGRPVTFRDKFTNPPIVIISSLSETSGAVTTPVGNSPSGTYWQAINTTKDGFTAHVLQRDGASNLLTNIKYIFTYIAIGN